MTAPAPDVPRVPWHEFLEQFVWQQGEHVSLIGPTGSGKTTLALGIIDRRDYVVALATKPEDSTMTKLARSPGWRKIPAWPPPPIAHRRTMRCVLWPRFRSPEDQERQRYEIDRALRAMFTEGRWCVFADELFYLCKVLRLERVLEMYWTQGRSIGLSLVGGTQRPAHVPLLMYDQATHLFFWRDSDEVNLKRVGGLGALNSRAIREVVAALPRHDVLYVNTRDDTLMVTRAERK